MKDHRWKQAAALMAALALCLSGGALAADQAESGGPIARELEVRAYQGVAYVGTLEGGGEGDTYALVTEPKRGSVTLEGDQFTYTAKKTGKDSFTYTVTDQQGRTSAPATVKITVTKAKTDVRYTDLEGDGAHTAAIRLAERGVFTGAQVGGSYFFEPQRTVSRGEFLAMVMDITGVETEPVTMTGFSDDGAMPAWCRSYAASAAEQGLIQGVPGDDGVAFAADDPITFNEAAAILDRTLSLSDVDVETWYADREAVPSWAAQAVGNLESVQVLAAGSFGSASMAEPLTRSDAARILCAAEVLATGEEKGLLSFLG